MQNSQNRPYNVPQEQWANFNNEDRQLFSKIYERERERKNDLIQRLEPECRDTVEQHFDSILGTMVADIIEHTQLQLT